MSLPEFNLRGTLDKGVHVCKSDEFFERFCYGNNTITTTLGRNTFILKLWSMKIK